MSEERMPTAESSTVESDHAGETSEREPTVEVTHTQPQPTAASSEGSPDNSEQVAPPADSSTPEDESKPMGDAEPPQAESTPDASNNNDEEEPDSDEPVYQAGMNWFVLRVASNKENYVRETLLRKVQIEGLADRVGRILVPTEKTKSVKAGKQRIVETKLYPGYVFVEMKLEDDGRIPQDVFFLIKETTGVGDFVGTAGRPAPMSRPEVEKMLHDSKAPEETPQVKVEFKKGDNVKITEGPFENHEGTVDEVFPEKGVVKVLVTIFGRQVPVEVEYWVIAPIEE